MRKGGVVSELSQYYNYNSKFPKRSPEHPQASVLKTCHCCIPWRILYVCVGFVINSRFELEFPILQIEAKLCLQNSIYTWLILQIKLIKSIKLVINQMKADCKN